MNRKPAANLHKTVHRLAGRRHLKRPGLKPGSIEAPPEAPPPRLSVRTYDAADQEVCDSCDLDTIRAWRRRRAVLWVDVIGIGDAKVLQDLATEFQIHPLAIEDVAHIGQRPKVELYGKVLLIVLYQVHLAPHPVLEQVSILLGEDWVLSFQERVGDPFDPVRQRIATTGSGLRGHGADFLAYALLDAVVDSYFHVVDELSSRLDRVEDELFRLSAPLPQRIRTHKREFLDLRRTLRPLREALATLHRDPLPLITDETRVFLRDSHDHVIQVLDQVDLGYDMASDQLAIFLNLATHRQSQVTEVLTVIATIFLPLTFIAGVYGMNFDPSSPWNMPELGWRYGYPAIMLFMLLVAIGMLIAFRRRGWIGGRKR